jgi:phosphoribosylformylglycinamidine synthase
LLDSAHDVSEGGLAQALVEAALRGDSGARITLPSGLDPFVALFSESTGRAVVSVSRAAEERFTELCAERSLPAVRIGVIDVLGPSLEVDEQFTVTLRDLRAAWKSTLPARFE